VVVTETDGTGEPEQPIEPGDFVVLSVTNCVRVGESDHSAAAPIFDTPAVFVGADHVPALESQVVGMTVGETGAIEYPPDGTGKAVTPVSEIVGESVAKALGTVDIESAWDLIEADQSYLELSLYMDSDKAQQLRATAEDQLRGHILVEFAITEHYRWANGSHPQSPEASTTESARTENDRSSWSPPVDTIGYVEEVNVIGSDGEKSVYAKSDTGALHTEIHHEILSDIQPHSDMSWQELVTETVSYTELDKQIRTPTDGSENRPMADLTIRVHGTEHQISATVRDRSHRNYDVLLGRDVVDQYNIDVSKQADK
jgi:hypothetical protein